MKNLAIILARKNSKRLKGKNNLILGGKSLIKRAIESRFNVKVKKVSTLRQRGKLKNTSIKSGGKVIRTSGYRKEVKKAIVTLLEGDKIDLVGGEV